MSREIKFRAWDEEQNKMWINLPLNQFFEEMSDLPIMQYTGLKDKNGTPIYEWDIVKYYGFDTIRTNVIKTGKVSYDGAYCAIGFVFLDSVSENIEVIGNIYENPELLKGENACK